MKTMLINATMTAIAVIGTTMPILASPVSTAMVKGGEKAAAKLGLRVAGKNAVRGGAKLAAVTAEREVAKCTAGEVAEGVAKHITAKRILATGGGTAMVVAAHETADGVQQMGEGVKEAVVSNPELAGGVAESVVAPVKWLVVMVGAAVLSVLVWILWPWVSLVKNWSRFAAGRRVAVMQGAASAAGSTVDVINVPPSSFASARSGFTRVEIIIMIAGFLVLTILGAWRIARSSSSSGVSAPIGSDVAFRQEPKIVERSNKVSQLEADYAAALDRHYAAFISEVESVSAAGFGDVRDGIPSVVKKFGTFSRCKDLVVTLVKDKMDKGSRTESGIKRDLEADFYRGLYDARDKVNECLVKFLNNAETERQSFRHELEKELDSIELPGDESYRDILADGGERIEKCKRELTEGQIAAAVSTVVEAACIRFTVSTVAKILGRAAARMAGSVTIGAGAALADGPIIPIGDIIGGALVLGSTCWTAYDIIQATKVLPKELGKTLNAVVDECESKTIADFKNAGEEIYSAYRNVRN